jgi:fructose-bisphosphate aldolase class II
MLCTLTQILSKAACGHYAVGAFNVNNLETLQAVTKAAEAERAPVIIQTSEGAINYAGLEELASLAHIAAKKTKRPVAFHLDHGKDIDLIMKAVKSGWYTSVMFDGSGLPYKENLALTKKIVTLAHKHKVDVEAELGAIAGIEDFVSVVERDAHLTDPKQAKDFVRNTKCDALAVAVGTKHGAYKFKGESALDFGRLKEIAEAVSVPLVLHGASGVPTNIKKICTDYGCEISGAKGVSDTALRKAVTLGIRKVNVDTDLRLAFDAGIRKFLKEKPEVIDPREILKPAVELMTKVVRQKIRVLGSSGKV